VTYSRNASHWDSPIADEDYDGSPDWAELRDGTDPNQWDTDGDLLSDGEEAFVYAPEGWNAAVSQSRNQTRSDYDDMQSYLFGWHHVFSAPGTYSGYLPTTIAVPETGYYAFGFFSSETVNPPNLTYPDGEGELTIDDTHGAVGAASLWMPGESSYYVERWSWATAMLEAGREYTLTNTGIPGDRLVWVRLTEPAYWFSHYVGAWENYPPFWSEPDALGLPDSDFNGLPDNWESAYSWPGGTHEAGSDADGDRITNLAEYWLGTNPVEINSDGDGFDDGAELYLLGSNPAQADAWAADDRDNDGLPSAWEIAHGLNPIVPDSAADSDSDGLSNFWEYQLGTDPVGADSDNDGTADGAEDTDGDGVSDGDEIAQGRDPLVRHVTAPFDTTRLRLWLNAGVGVETDAEGKASQWLDQSGYGHHAVQAQPERRPSMLPQFSNGQPALQFDGEDDWMGFLDSTGMELSGATVFVVFRLEEGASTDDYYPITLGGTIDQAGRYLGIETRGSNSGGSPDTLDIFAGWGSDRRVTLPGIAAFDDVQIMAFSANGTIHTATASAFGMPAALGNEGSDAQLSFPIGTPDGLGFGGIGGSPWMNLAWGWGGVMKGQVAEVLVFDRELSPLDLNSVTLHLVTKYGFDPDGDGLSNQQETALGTDPQMADTDGDGLSDGNEVSLGTDPKRLDSDADGLADGEEVLTNGTNPLNPDTDNDGLSDGYEVANAATGQDPLNPDVNGDGVPDGQEDRDGDGWTASEEDEAGSLDTLPDTDGDGVNDPVDCLPGDPDIKYPRVPTTRYAVVNLARDGFNVVTFWYGGLSNNGIVFGYVGNSNPALAGEATAYWQAGNVSMAPFTWITRVNDTGKAAGVLIDESSGEWTVGTWMPGESSLTALGELLPPGAPSHQRSTAFPSGINSSGLVVGRTTTDSYGSDDYDSEGHLKPVGQRGKLFRAGVRWDGAQSPAAVGDFLYLDPPEEGSPTSPCSVNNAGIIVCERASTGVVLEQGGETILPLPANGRFSGSWFISGINNDAATPVTVGMTYGGLWTNWMWARVSGEWKRKNLGSIGGGSAVPGRSTGQVFDVNDRLEIVGNFWDAATLRYGNLWRNGRMIDVTDFCDGIGNATVGAPNEPLYINDQGMISTMVTGNGIYYPALLLPVDMAVDGNRDGEVKMGSSSDATTQEKPFVFWVNDDFDRDNEEETSGTPDWNDGLIQCARDLEDFSRIKISVGGVREGFQQGKFKLGFEWKQTTGSPAVQVYPQVEESGAEGYLKDEQVAAAQIEPGIPTGRWAFVAEGGGTLIGTGQAKVFATMPTSIATRNFEEDGMIHLLFEGCGEGKGQLCITIHDENGAKIGDGPGVWLDLKDVRKMYQRSYSQESIAWKKPNEYNPYQEPVVSIAPLDQIAFEQPPDETSDTIVLVHGIHAVTVTTEAQAINVYTRMASTTFKRLWHQGFKGRFGFYKWEAHNLVFFNESEYRAWKCGRGLSAFLDQLPGQNKNVWTFSQGAVVGSAALRDYGATPNALIVMQAAIPAVCYDDDPALNKYPNAMPDTVAELGYREYHGPTGTSIVNFSDVTDDATGFLWGASQNFKPEPGYGYNPAALPGQRHTVTYFWEVGRFVTDLHESLSMIARSKSETIAHEPGAGGLISTSVPINASFGFSNEHGAAFDRPIQKNLNDFYDEVLTQFGIPFNP